MSGSVGSVESEVVIVLTAKMLNVRWLGLTQEFMRMDRGFGLH
jgi:hypothetical protein